MDLSHVQKGQAMKPMSAEFYNALVDVVRRELIVKRGVVDGSSISSKEVIGTRKSAYVYANENIPAYSIFTITDSGVTGELDPRYPQVGTKTVTDEADPVCIINEEKSLGAGGAYLLNVIGDEHPRLVAYDGTDGVPTVGDELGVVPGTYKVGMKRTGLVAVSLPDTVNSIIWVLKKTISVTDCEDCCEDCIDQGCNVCDGNTITGEFLAEAVLTEMMCGNEDDDNEQVYVKDAKLIPSCTDIDLSSDTILNTCKHQGGVGDKVRLVRTCVCSGTGSGTGDECTTYWDVYDVKRHATCLVNQVQSRDFCMVQLIVKTAVERCGGLDSTCTILEYIKDCTIEGNCDSGTEEDEFSLADCCFVYQLGTGSWAE